MSDEIKSIADATKEVSSVLKKGLNLFEKVLPDWLAKKDAKAQSMIQDAANERRMKQLEEDKKYCERKLEIIGEISARLGLGIEQSENILDIFQITASSTHQEDIKPPTRKFIADFIDCSKNSYDEDLKKLWANILNQELSEPSSISSRTLEFVKTLSKEEALTIEKALASTIGNLFIPMFDKKDSNDIALANILIELNLGNSQPNAISLKPEVLFKLTNDWVLLIGKNAGTSYAQSCVELNKVGIELKKVVAIDPVFEKIIQTLKHFIKESTKTDDPHSMFHFSRLEQEQYVRLKSYYYNNEQPSPGNPTSSNYDRFYPL